MAYIHSKLGTSGYHSSSGKSMRRGGGVRDRPHKRHRHIIFEASVLVHNVNGRIVSKPYIIFDATT